MTDDIDRIAGAMATINRDSLKGLEEKTILALVVFGAAEMQLRRLQEQTILVLKAERDELRNQLAKVRHALGLNDDDKS